MQAPVQTATPASMLTDCDTCFHPYRLRRLLPSLQTVTPVLSRVRFDPRSSQLEITAAHGSPADCLAQAAGTAALPSRTPRNGCCPSFASFVTAFNVPRCHDVSSTISIRQCDIYCGGTAGRHQKEKNSPDGIVRSLVLPRAMMPFKLEKHVLDNPRMEQSCHESGGTDHRATSGSVTLQEPPGRYITRQAAQAWLASESLTATTHVSELLGTRLGLLASICQSTTRTQVMTRL